MRIPASHVIGPLGAKIGVVFVSVSPADSGESTMPERPADSTEDEGAALVREPVVAPEVHSAQRQRGVPRTRWSAAWAGICAAVLALVALIVFMLQNTRSVEVSFLWMHGTLPLALALLIAAVGAAIMTMVFGAGRITQLRLLARRRRE